jgi:predicted Zn-dependent protease
MSQTLSGYITECRRLLHDANANFYSNPELTDYINQARQRLVRDTGCLRTYQTSATVTNQEVYTFA